MVSNIDEMITTSTMNYDTCNWYQTMIQNFIQMISSIEEMIPIQKKREKDTKDWKM